ncbi:SO_0444 family Cu/Zn efflux transporter [Desulfobacterales bacterium HSG2]|nr:SO_0444 family Cu/Zn efflux transporter [Desulfobacterales bacterium HSG2]
MNFITNIFLESWNLLLDASVYILFGILVGGLLKIFLSPAMVASHLGKRRFASVFKAAIFGIPIPLCSCGVLPAAASLKKQGANNGAVTAFLISTPESGVDSIAITYALLDPIMTAARPISAFLTAVAAGLTENLLHAPSEKDQPTPDLSCAVDGCCDGIDCPPEEHAQHHSFTEKLRAGLHFAFTELWGDLAGWFFVGLILAGVITALVPEDIMVSFLGGGILSMIIMLAAGIPLYICATASTPIAAALILKGVSPGAALVFLLVGPATNVTSLTVLLGILGKRAAAIYLSTLAVLSVIFGLILDQVYTGLGLSARAVAGQAGEVIPFEIQLAGTIVLLALSVRPVWESVNALFRKSDHHHDNHNHNYNHNESCDHVPSLPIEPPECRTPS